MSACTGHHDVQWYLDRHTREHLNKNTKLGGESVCSVKPELGHRIAFSFDTFILKKHLEKTLSHLPRQTNCTMHSAWIPADSVLLTDKCGTCVSWWSFRYVSLIFLGPENQEEGSSLMHCWVLYIPGICNCTSMCLAYPCERNWTPEFNN